jgi:ABC-type transport system involved in multi-copper enzyme maturation permease subunit
MNLPSALLVVRCLIRDTFRQSLASRTFWLILGLSGICILLCLSVRVEGVTAHTPRGEIELYGQDRQPYTGLNPGRGQFSFVFGALRWPLTRDGAEAVRFLQALLAKWAAGAVGIFLILLWTSGFLPEFLQPRAATVLLAKPIPRWSLLVGKYLGVLVFVTFQVAVFVGGTWLALGVRTGYWNFGYLLCIPLLVIEFTILYSCSALLAVWTRSTVVCIFGTLVFWSVCASVNYNHSLVVNGSPPVGVITDSDVIEAVYWVLPKPGDVVLLLGDVLNSQRHFKDRPDGVAGRQAGVDVEASLFTSLLFTGVVLALAGRRFVRREY